MIPETTASEIATHSPTPTPRPAYTRADCTLTLREGLDEYRQSMPDLIDERDLGERARSLFHNHDIAHVVFGCDISIRHEAMVDTWSMFGTDVGVRAYLEYLDVPEAKQVLKDVGIVRASLETMKNAGAIARVLRNAYRMKKRWPFFLHDEHLDRRLDEIREEFGIAIVA